MDWIDVVGYIVLAFGILSGVGSVVLALREIIGRRRSRAELTEMVDKLVRNLDNAGPIPNEPSYWEDVPDVPGLQRLRDQKGGK